MANQMVWADIPVKDLDRAVKFYSAVFGVPVKKEELPGMAIGILPHQDGEVGGCLFKTASSGFLVANRANAIPVHGEEGLRHCTAEALRPRRRSNKGIILNKPSANSAPLW